jgi:aspartate aminotransferase-like enzyme
MMVVRAGREFLAIPGPTNMPDEVLQAMHRPALDIYSDQMVDLTDGLLRDLSNCSPPRAAPTSTSPTATAPGKPR